MFGCVVFLENIIIITVINIALLLFATFKISAVV